jgi:DNA adenine methylase
MILASPRPRSLPPTAPRPFLKWAGGKGQLIPQYSQFFPQEFDTYYEPFLGGGAVFFHLQPRRSVLMDINPELVNVYTCVRDRVEDLISLLEVHQEQHCETHYYRVRSNPSDHPLERAARFIYLNKTCFNGLYRENSKGPFNVPMGRYKNPRVCHAELLRSVSLSLRNAQVLESPFDAMLHQVKGKRSFVYFDPPYYPISPTSNFTAYNRYSFSAADQIHLRDVFAELAGRGVKVMLSNSRCPFTLDLYRDFNIHTITASRAINSDPAKRGKISEILVTSY